MSMPDSDGRDASRDDSSPATEKPTVISANDARQGPPGHELLYVLGFGTTETIFALRWRRFSAEVMPKTVHHPLLQSVAAPRSAPAHSQLRRHLPEE
jgi:hypothetical protein